MLTRDALASLSDSLGEQQVLSVYIDGRTTDPATRVAWRSTLGANLAALGAKIREGARDDRRAFDRCRALLEQQLAPIAGALSAPGFVAFVTADHVVLAESLPVAMPDVAEWGFGPWISPYLRAQKELRPVVLAIVDARSARSYRYALGDLSPLEHFHAYVQTDEPTHMGSLSRQGFHTGTRGATTADAVERARQHGTERMLHEVVEHLASVASGDEWIVIGGMPMRAALLLTMLPPTARERAVVATGLSAVTAASALRRVARERARQLRQRQDRAIVDTAIARAAERARGSVGEDATRAALKLNDVHALLISTAFMNDHPDVAEELARLALAEGSTIEVVSPPAADRLNRAGGIAAILRYVVPVTPVELAVGAPD